MAVCEKCEETYDPGIMGSTAYCDHCSPGPPTTCPICDEPWFACHHDENHVIAHLLEELRVAQEALSAASRTIKTLGVAP